MILDYLLAFLVVLLPVLLPAIAWRKKPEWYDSEVNVSARLSWGKLLVVSAVFGVTVASSFFVIKGGVLPTLSVFLVSWLLPIVCVTDFKAYKIPKDVSVITYYAGLALGLLAALYAQSWFPLISVGVAFIVPAILAFVKGIGFGDVRLIMLFSFALPWWMGLSNWVTGLMLGAIIQLLIFVLSYFFKWGKMIKIAGKDKEKKVLPFGPALILGYIAMAFLTKDSTICVDLLCDYAPIF